MIFRPNRSYIFLYQILKILIELLRWESSLLDIELLSWEIFHKMRYTLFFFNNGNHRNEEEKTYRIYIQDNKYRHVKLLVQFSSVDQSCLTLRPHESQHNRPPCPSPTPGVYSDSHPSSQWCHPAISSSVVPFSSCSQSLPASESFPMSQFFAWGGQSTGVSASASFLPKKSQGWAPPEWTDWISLQSKGVSRVFSNTTVQKHQFFGTQPSSQSKSHIHTWPQEKP